MPKNILPKTNLLVSLIIIAGFVLVFIVDYQSNYKIDEKNIEYISELTSEGIYNRLETIFAEPIGVSLTMANDNLLKAYLINETQDDDKSFVQTIQSYLAAYKEKHGYDSVFLASVKTNRYYNFNGINRILTVDNPENNWYHSFLESDEEYSLNVDNDEAAQNEITVFINCRIIDTDGIMLGVVGVGFQIDGLQSLLMKYAETYDVDIYLINESGNIEIAIDSTGWQPVNFFDVCGYPQFKEEILQSRGAKEVQTYWHPEHGGNNYIVARHIPKMEWHLIVEHNTASLEARMGYKLYTLVFALFITILIVIFTITFTIRRFNKNIIELTALVEREKHAAIKHELTRKAETDGFTGLYNKEATKRYIGQILTDNPEKNFAFFIIDLDNLKLINDRHGHAFGDLVIDEFAKVIKSQFRESDVNGRIGGDEFAVFLPVSGVEFMTKKVKALSAALDSECTDGSTSIPFSASIGAALAPRDGTDFETLYKHADKALYEAKRRGKNRYIVYGEQEQTVTSEI